MNKIISTIIVLCIFLQVLNATALEVSPSSALFNQKVDEEKCVQIIIKQDQRQELTLEDIWKLGKASNELEAYDLKDTPVTITYPKKISEKESYQKICITPKDEQNFSGIILIMSETKTAAVGVRIEVNPNVKEEQSENNQVLITGNIAMFLVNILIIILLKNYHETTKKQFFRAK